MQFITRQSQAKVNNLCGQTFGSLKVLAFAPRTESDRYYRYICQCECGDERVVASSKLVAGTIKACVACTKQRRYGKAVKAA